MKKPFTVTKTEFGVDSAPSSLLNTNRVVYEVKQAAGVSLDFCFENVDGRYFYIHTYLSKLLHLNNKHFLE